MDGILSGQVLVNGVDIWLEYGAFLVEEKRGDMNNLKAIFAPSDTKSNTAVDVRERDGKDYAEKLTVANEERDVELCFAIYAKTQAAWLKSYMAFIGFLKSGDDGWLEFSFPGIGITMKVFYKKTGSYTPLTYLWKEGVQASRFKVTFCEPEPII